MVRLVLLRMLASAAAPRHVSALVSPLRAMQRIVVGRKHLRHSPSYGPPRSGPQQSGPPTMRAPQITAPQCYSLSCKRAAWRSYFHCRAKWRIVLFFFIHVLMVPPSLPTTSVAHGNCSLHTHVAETEAHIQGVHAQQESLAWLPLESGKASPCMFCSGSLISHAENRLFIIVLTNHFKPHSQRTHYHHS